MILHYRVDELKAGTLVGVDKYGNKYYENNSNFVGKFKKWKFFSYLFIVWMCKIFQKILHLLYTEIDKYYI